ncbi:ImmA/IrrE family metallo-endopeptidase [Anaerotruncus rubiinfantis]|uniref:ImmA/IrrE family metallo-endopeptidase n=1 Tax=Anaerotruncus rubiinfantis TaxID=1720200 RepID=UPI0034A2C56C
MSEYCAKELLYHKIAALRERLGLGEDQIPDDLPDACRKIPNLALEVVCFNTPGLRGIACIGDADSKDVILLNRSESPKEQSFSCGHELIHITLHRSAKRKTWSCFDKVRENQNRFLEWQANEGSAELHLPYRLLLPAIREYRGTLDSWRGISAMKKELAERFCVSEVVLQFRLESLKYEIEQYLHDLPLDEVRILSASGQDRLGIRIRSLNAAEEEGRRRDCEALLHEPPPAPDALPLSDRDLRLLSDLEERWLYDV